jgi:hypothetical protein
MGGDYPTAHHTAPFTVAMQELRPRQMGIEDPGRKTPVQRPRAEVTMI